MNTQSDLVSKNYLPSAKEMQALELACINQGISAEELMERAGLECFKLIKSNFKLASTTSVIILLGPGNNGGDGYVIARHLVKNKIAAKLIVANSDKYTELNLIKRSEFLELSNQLYFFDHKLSDKNCQGVDGKEHELVNILGGTYLLIDCLLGTGQTSALRGNIKHLLTLTNKYINSIKKIAIDLPTGVSCDSGAVDADSFRADLTICIQFIKRGLLQYPARALCGEIKIVDIGIQAINATEFQLIDPQRYSGILKRKNNVNKGDFGHVFVIAGSRAMPGAAELAARAALRTGAGKVTCLAFTDTEYLWNTPEVMRFHLKCDSDYLSSKNLPEILAKANQCSTLVIGPGLGMEPETSEFIIEFLNATPQIPKVIDADGLNHLSKVIENFSEYKRLNNSLQNACLTPHPKELANLLGIQTAEVETDRYQAIINLASKTNSCCLLKGAASIVYQGQSGFVNPISNPFLATAGSGDVLSGIVAGLLAQGLSSLDALCLAVYLHTQVANKLSQEKKPLIASDLIDGLPLVMPFLFN